MNDFEKIIKNISDIKKEMYNKNVELAKLKDKQFSLNEELEMYQTKISWLKEDLEDMVCNYSMNAKRIYVEDEEIIIEMFHQTSIDLLKVKYFAEMIGRELDDCKIDCDADGALYVHIKL